MPSNIDPLPRGSVVRVRFNPTEGSEQSGERPALVVSPDFINERSPVVIVAAITSRKADRVYPTEVLIEQGEGGLPLLSKVMLLHLRSVDKTRITQSYGMVSAATMERVNAAIQIATGLVEI